VTCIGRFDDDKRLQPSVLITSSFSMAEILDPIFYKGVSNGKTLTLSILLIVQHRIVLSDEKHA
jgi:hypothetical protein